MITAKVLQYRRIAKVPAERQRKLSAMAWGGIQISCIFEAGYLRSTHGYMTLYLQWQLREARFPSVDTRKSVGPSFGK